MQIRVAHAIKRLCAVAMFLSAGAGAAGAAGAEARLDALEQACRTGDQRAIAEHVGELKSFWGAAPDYRAIGDAALSRDADPWFRWVMIDSLVAYKRSVKNSRDAASLLDLLDKVSWADNDSPFVRAKSVTVQAGLISLFGEQGFIPEKRRREFGKKLAALLESEKDGELLAAACIAAGNAEAQEAVPALRKHARGENASPLVRRTAAGSLGQLKDRDSIPLLADIMGKTDDRELFGSSAFALGTMGGDEVVEPLVANAGRFDTHSCRNAL
jgi:HEAT repeat protein